MPNQNYLLEFTEYITPDGQTFRFESDTKFLLSESGSGMPPITYQTQKGAYQHGESPLDYRLQPRVIQMVIRQNGVSRTNYWANRANLMDFFRPNRWLPGVNDHGVLRKTFPDGSRRDLNVIIQQGPEFVARQLDTWDEWAISETVRFIAYNPIYFDPALTTIAWSLAAIVNVTFPITFPFSLDGRSILQIDNPATYLGTWPAYPTITVTGPGTGFTLLNTTTGEELGLNYRIASGEVVTFNLSFGYKTVTSSTNGNLIGAMTRTSDLSTFHIACAPEAVGGVNHLIATLITNDPAAGISLTYHAQYIGY